MHPADADADVWMPEMARSGGPRRLLGCRPMWMFLDGSKPTLWQPAKIIGLIYVMQRWQGGQAPAQLAHSRPRDLRHAGRAPGDILKQAGIKSVQCHQDIATVKGRHERGLAGKQVRRRLPNPLGRKTRAIGSHQQHRVARIQRTLSSPCHALAQVTMALTAYSQRWVLRQQPRPHGIFRCRRHTNLHGPHLAGQRLCYRMFQHQGSEAGSSRCTQRRYQSCLGKACDGCFGEDDDVGRVGHVVSYLYSCAN